MAVGRVPAVCLFSLLAASPCLSASPTRPRRGFHVSRRLAGDGGVRNARWNPHRTETIDRVRGGCAEVEDVRPVPERYEKLYAEARRIIDCGDDWYQVIWGRPGAENEKTLGMNEKDQYDQLKTIIRRMRADVHPDRLRGAPKLVQSAAQQAYDRLLVVLDRIEGVASDTIPWVAMNVTAIYKVVWPGGVVVRSGEGMDGASVAILRQGALIHASEAKGRRVRITYPVEGWVSVHKDNGSVLLQRHDDEYKKLEDGRPRRFFWPSRSRRRNANDESEEGRRKRMIEFLAEFYKKSPGLVIKLAEKSRDSVAE